MGLLWSCLTEVCLLCYLADLGLCTLVWVADCSADKSADRSVWIRMEKIDRPYLTDMGNN
jgi:hypothetical protein